MFTCSQLIPVSCNYNQLWKCTVCIRHYRSNRPSVNMTEICTFVFFDIETTGLITCIQPKITELAFTACTREHLLNANKNEIPRVVHKLLLPFNPAKVIQPESTRITGKIAHTFNHCIMILITQNYRKLFWKFQV